MAPVVSGGTWTVENAEVARQLTKDVYVKYHNEVTILLRKDL